MIENLQYLSILIEVVIAIFGILIAVQKKRNYGWAIFLTFGIYVFYDFAKLVNIVIDGSVLYIMFFIATLSFLIGVIKIYKEKK